MNKKLQNILEIIQQSEKLDAEQKVNLIEAVKNADKELEITAFKLERTEKVKKTTAILLEETIAELEQKRKDVEKHNRELEIEAALERVRARGMAMRTSEELRALIGTLFTELTKLDLELTRCVIWIIDPKTNDAIWWLANSEDPSNPMSYLIPYHKKSPYLAFLKEWEKRTVKWVYDLKGQTKKNWDNHLFAKTELSKMPKFIRDGMRAPDRVLLSASFSNFGGMNVASLEPLSDEHFDILLRFAKVFDLTYTRFNDLKKAEAQARESEIQLALERVRARTMAMQKSDELLDAASLLFQQVKNLGCDPFSCGFVLLDKNKPDGEFFMSAEGKFQPSVFIPNNDESAERNMFLHWKKGEKLYTEDGEGKDLVDHFAYLMSLPGKTGEMFRAMKKAGIKFPKWQRWHAAYFSRGYLLFITKEPFEETSLFPRFASLFEQTYTRFLDLQKAEAQAKEAQVEAALERVRSRSMAMHKSDEIAAVASVLFHQLQQLDLPNLRRCLIGIVNEKKGKLQSWHTSLRGDSTHKVIDYPIDGHPVIKKKIKGWRKGKPFSIELSPEELKDFIKYIVKHGFGYQKGEKPATKLIQNHAPFKYGYLEVATHEPIADQEFELIQRFARVFEQTYTRFLDLQKAEAQAREAEIELALERVRARTMAMQKSEELAEVARIVFEQLTKLGIQHLASGVTIIDKNKPSGRMWISYRGDMYPKPFAIDFDSSPVLSRVYKSWKEGNPFFINQTSGQEFRQHIQFLKTVFGERVEQYMEATKKQFKDAGKEMPGQMVMHHTFFSNGSLLLNNTEPIKEQEILNRFAKVFDQTYTRFVDLQKAEAQARESEIELALERVRAKTMAMHNSDELGEVASVLFEQISSLTSTPDRFNIAIANEEDKSLDVWITDQEGHKITQRFIAKTSSSPVVAELFQGWKKQEDHLILDLYGEKLEKWIRYMGGELGMPFKKDSVKDHRFVSSVYFSHGFIGVTTHKEPDPETMHLLERFSKVFQQTYIRFLDLQKAEAQAREAKIEAALERVRARSMAMHESQELREIIACVFEELQKLDFVAPACSLIFYQDDKSAEHWFAGFTEGAYPQSYTIPYTDIPYYTDLLKAWKEGSEYEEFIMEGQAKVDYAKWLLSETDFKNLPKEFVEGSGMQTPIPLYFSDAYNKYGMLEVIGNESLPEAKAGIVKRLSKVFEQAYTRFLDLQKAEAQAREALIEASLEKVRARAMAMHSSDDLGETVDAFFSELTHLNVMPHRCGVGIMNPETRTVDINATTATQENERKKITGKLKLSGHPILDKVFENWNLQKEYHPVLRGKEILDYYKVMNPQVEFPDFAGDEIQYGYYFYFKEGGVFGWTEKELSETDLNIFRRFTSVLSLTYRRYLDLREAEAQTREAVKQASLDRVRGEIASMRTSEDLNRITPVIWRELKALEVPFIRCGVFIVDEANKTVGVFLTTPDGKALGVLHLAFDSNELTSNTVENWRKKQVYKEHWNKEDFINWTKSMMKLGQVQNAETYQGSSKPPESLHLHFVPFAQGMLYVGNVDPLDDEKLELAKTLAEAFSIAYARYEDFKNLEEAKAAIENTLKELKSAQAQLVHSEKMASLGELTAGIAHEIKNPLNFVNNFSEVSSELIDEMIEELQKGNNEDALYIVKDLKQNLEKINNHGKRADSIVKGMLLHSRGTAGEKAPTDINDLLEQYVNLAYHGMRAQNKDFNITIERDYDKSLDKIKVVPQDISRVFLNIINNGCYSANDKKKKDGDDFSPTIKVSTINLKDKVEIRIKDNGNGIPKDILDKIFQPFFTTKPTGEGTGLGLSLSYDIVVKQHGGEIKIESKEGEGAEFIIQLPNQ